MKTTKSALALAVTLAMGGAVAAEASEDKRTAGIFFDSLFSLVGKGAGIDVAAAANSTASKLAPRRQMTVSGVVENREGTDVQVNGVTFDVSGAAFDNDGETGSSDDLKSGMKVTLEGSVSATGDSGVATSVSYDTEIKGPIEAAILSEDEDTLTITVMGINIVIAKTATVFEGLAFEMLEVGDYVEVYGTTNADGTIVATRVEAETPDAGVDQSMHVEVRGMVAALEGTSFTLGNYTVDASNAYVEHGDASEIVEGAVVEVEGVLSGMTITATKIEIEYRAPVTSTGANDTPQDPVVDSTDESADDSTSDNTQAAYQRVYGVVSEDPANPGVFFVNDQVVDTSAARFKPSNLVIEAGISVVVEGQLIDGVLVASEIELRKGEMSLSASVSAVNEGSLDVMINGQVVTVLITSLTMFDDDRNHHGSTSAPEIFVGDFVELDVYQNAEGELVATHVDIEHHDDEVEVEGTVDEITNTEISVMGITYSIDDGTRFKIDGQGYVTADVFFAMVVAGDTIEVEDNAPADGIADKLELKSGASYSSDDDRYEDSDDDSDDDRYEDSDDDSDDDRYEDSEDDSDDYRYEDSDDDSDDDRDEDSSDDRGSDRNDDRNNDDDDDDDDDDDSDDGRDD